MTNELETNLNNMLHACALQARWHHEQYLRLQYCQRYFAYLLHYRQQFDENYLENLLRNLNTGTTNENIGEDSEFATNCENAESPAASLDHIVSPVRKKKKKRKSKVKASKARENNSRNSFSETIDNESESGLDLNDGFKEFLRESSKFRADRDSRKNLLTTSEDLKSNPMKEEVVVEYVDILRKGPDGSILPPTAQNRKILYEEKYGQSGTTILSLETALQWKHNKFVDSTCPVTWPSLPLRLVYGD